MATRGILSGTHTYAATQLQQGHISLEPAYVLRTAGVHLTRTGLRITYSRLVDQHRVNCAVFSRRLFGLTFAVDGVHTARYHDQKAHYDDIAHR